MSLIRLIITIQLCFVVLNSAYAKSAVEPLPKGKAADILWGNSSSFHADFDKAVDGNCSSLMERLKTALQDSNLDTKYAAHAVYGEIYDRGICVDFNPEKAFENFMRAADMGGPSYYAIVGWKYYNGHGVTQSQEKANEAFKLLLIRSSYWKEENYYSRFQNILRGREMPDMLQMGTDWLVASIKTIDQKIAFANLLIYGGGSYYDASPIPKDLMTGKYILEGLWNNPKASYYLGFEYLKGTFGEKNKQKGERYLMQSAQCGHVPAMLKLAALSQTGELGVRQNDKNVYGWYLMASKNGADVSGELEKAKENIGSYLQLSAQKDSRFKVNLKRCQN